MAQRQAPGVTRPENLNSSAKRQTRSRFFHQHLLPVSPPPASVLNSFLSALRIGALTPPQIQAVYDVLTKTVTVSSESDMVILWRRGFFGKGTLSRSEPAFKRRVDNMRAPLEGREKKLTAEEVTAQRRVERIATKLGKKAEREAEKLAAASAAASEWGTSAGGSIAPASPRGSPEEVEDEGGEELLDTLEAIVEGKEGEAGAGAALEEESEVPPDEMEADEEEPPPEWHLTAESTQLQPEEAFFLLFSLGCLSLRSADPWRMPSAAPSPAMSIQTAWKTFLLDAASPPSPSSLSPTIDSRLTRWDSPFLISYAVYHHYRSMGWVIRSGVKFCADWVLYGPGGPVGGHAEFAVVVIPSYVDPEDAKSCPFNSAQGSGAALAEGETKGSWKWFNTVNRVCSGVKKTLVLVYILIPPISTLPSPTWILEHPAEALAKFEIREVTVRRWMAGRMRD